MTVIDRPLSTTSLDPAYPAVVRRGHHHSGVSWPAVIAGAVGAAALSLILLVLGTGLGLASVSPWSGDGVNAATFGVSTIVWVTLMSLLSSGMGGYLAGRLGARWDGLHTDEVYFRDTAHGFLAWALATLLTATLLSSAVGALLGAGAKAGGAVASAIGTAGQTAAVAGAAASTPDKGGKSDDSMGYFTDTLFRKNAVNPLTGAAPAATEAPAPTDNVGTAGELTRILANAVATGSLPPDDLRYAGQVVAQRTGVTQAEGEKRVTDTYALMQKKIEDAKTAAKTAADEARKASSHAALWIFVSLLFGAFVASLLATVGGRHRSTFN